MYQNQAIIYSSNCYGKKSLNGWFQNNQILNSNQDAQKKAKEGSKPRLDFSIFVLLTFSTLVPNFFTDHFTTYFIFIALSN